MKKAIYVFLIPIALLCAGLASAAITLTDTGSDTTFVGSGKQVRFTMNSTGDNYAATSVTGCNASLTSSLTSNTTNVWTVSYNASLTVNANMTWVINITSARYEDANDYTVKINCSNATASFYQGTLSTGNTVDNTDPTEATSVSPSDGVIYSTNNTVHFSATITESNTIDTYVVWRDMTPSGKAKDLMTCTGTSCTLSVTNVPRGIYYYAIQTSDRTDDTNTAYRYFSEQYGKMTGAAKIALYSETEPSGFQIPPIVIVLGIAAVLYYISTSKKK